MSCLEHMPGYSNKCTINFRQTNSIGVQMMGDVNSPTSSSAFDLSTNQTSTTSTVVILPPFPSSRSSSHQAQAESPVHQVLPERFWKTTKSTSAIAEGEEDGEHTVLINKVEDQSASSTGLDEAPDGARAASASSTNLKASPCSSSSSSSTSSLASVKTVVNIQQKSKTTVQAEICQ